MKVKALAKENIKHKDITVVFHKLQSSIKDVCKYSSLIDILGHVANGFWEGWLKMVEDGLRMLWSLVENVGIFKKILFIVFNWTWIGLLYIKYIKIRCWIQPWDIIVWMSSWPLLLLDFFWTYWINDNNFISIVFNALFKWFATYDMSTKRNFKIKT